MVCDFVRSLSRAGTAWLRLLILVPAIASLATASFADGLRVLQRLEDGRAANIVIVGSPAGDPETAARRFFIEEAPLLFHTVVVPDLRLARRTESLTGSHLRFDQYVDGEPVIDGGVAVDIDQAGSIRSVANATAIGDPLPARVESSSAEERVAPESRGSARYAVRSVLLNDSGIIRRAWRVERRISATPFVWYVDSDSGRIIRRESIALDVSARVFKQNPVEKLNATGLQDDDNAASAVPSAAYDVVDLPDLAPSGPLSGPNVMLAELEAPIVPLADSSQSLMFDRSQSGFEEVNVYYHVDLLQRYLQSLGYTGTRRIIPYPIKADAHAVNGADNSFFLPTAMGVGELHYGDGGVDDAEDPDIITHEYGHAIQESIAPSTFAGAFSGQARAMGEGFGDYWAFSNSYAEDLISGRDPFCIGDWDARCADGPSTNCGYPSGADCLRRVDGSKTLDDYVFSNTPGVEHQNGEIWSSALREIFMGIVGLRGIPDGKEIADRIILESQFGAPPLPQFETLAARMLEADQELYAGSYDDLICTAFTLRKILTGGECNIVPRGDQIEIQSSDRDLPIPDNNQSGVLSTRVVADDRTIESLQVRVDIVHPFRGDLRIMLTAPNGQSVLLQQADGGPGANLNVTYGLDDVPAESLDAFNGMAAAGTWTLHVADTNRGDVGRLVSWSLIFHFTGDAPITSRPATTQHLVIPAVANLPGEAGANFHTDVRIYNRSQAAQTVTLFYTPDGNDGRDFAAQRMEIDAGETAALDDIVESEFRSGGVGWLEIVGDPSALMASSRTYSLTPAGTLGELIPAQSDGEALSQSDVSATIPRLLNTTEFRSNIGFTEIAGVGGDIMVTFYDASGNFIDSLIVSLPPWGHTQFAAFGGRGGTSVPAASAVVTVRTPGMRVLSYGSVVDNLSGDPFYIAAEKNVSSDDQVVPVVFRGGGDRGTEWHSDVWLTNLAAFPQERKLIFVDNNGNQLTSTLTVDVAAGGSAQISDVLQSFGLDSGSGSLRVVNDLVFLVPPTIPLLVTSRSWTDGEAGTFGQSINGRNGNDGILLGGSATAIQLDNSTAFRTNLGATEVAGFPVVVRFSIQNAAGTQLFSSDVSVPANGRVQFNPANAGAPHFTDGRATFELISGEGRVLPYASVIDNGTGDPVYIEGK